MERFPNTIVHSSGVQLKLERDRVVVTTESTASASTDPLAEMGLVPESEARTARASGGIDPKRVLNERSGRVWARSEDGSAVAAPQVAASRPDGLSSIGPVYTGDFGGEEVSVGVRTDVLVVTPSAGRKEAEEHLKSLGLEIDDERTKYLGNELWCEVKDPLEASSLDLVSEVADSPAIAEARLEMIPMYRPHSYQPNDPLAGDQWNIRQIRAAGAGHTGWNDQRGVASVIIGVLDDGVQLDHPDLRIAANGIDLGTMADDGSPNGNHGTACAGCAAAIIQNGEGVAGVAGGCSVLPIAFDTWSDTEVAAGIRYAVANDVNVLSMSFGWDPWDPDVIDPAIQEAYDAGIVMCVATHNYNRRGITYPATNPLVMACGASDQVDDRKSPSSPDGEGWGSNYGPQMSVVAPGVLIPTTDRLGNAGYAAGDYTMAFNGTSSATPQVAGLAALLLSCDSSLSPLRVREIIETTAAKVGSVGYAPTLSKPNGTWNEQMGYGRIDVEAAVHDMCKRPTVLEGIDWSKFKFLFEDFKWRQIKEKERLDELKDIRSYELPDFEPVVDELIRPQDLIDEPGRLFVDRADRNLSSDDLARTVRRRR